MESTSQNTPQRAPADTGAFVLKYINNVMTTNKQLETKNIKLEGKYKLAKRRAEQETMQNDEIEKILREAQQMIQKLCRILRERRSSNLCPRQPHNQRPQINAEYPSLPRMIGPHRRPFFWGAENEKVE